LLAKNVNDDAGMLRVRGALRFFASKLAPQAHSQRASRRAKLYAFSRVAVGWSLWSRSYKQSTPRKWNLSQTSTTQQKT